MIITLCGFMGAGKSTIGKMLAQESAYLFVDLDSYIELKFGETVSDIFKRVGESNFREKEYDALNEVIINYKQKTAEKQNGLILALGGGTLLNENCVRLIKQETYCVYLKCTLNELLKRLKKNNSHRPLLSGKSEEDISITISNLMEQREPIYLNCANLVYNVCDNTLVSIVKNLKDKINL